MITDGCGGRLDIDQQPDDVQDCLFDLRWRGKKLLDNLRFEEWQTVDRCVFDFCAGSEIDAVCKVADRVCYIGVSYGLVARAYEVAHALLALPNFLPDLGLAKDPSLQSAAEAEVGPFLFGDARPSRTHGFVSPPSCTFAPICSTDEDRRWAAHGIAGYFMQWVLYHEWMHASCGHLHLASEMTGRPIAALSLHEFGGPANVLAEWAHLVEFDADRRAMWRVTAEIFDDNAMLLCALRYGTLTLAQRLDGLWSLLLIMICSMCGGEIDVNLPVPDHHPRPAVRFFTAFVRAHEDWEREHEDDVETLHQAINGSVNRVRRLWLESGRSGDPFASWIAAVDRLLDEVNKLGQRQQSELIPRLSKWDFFQRANRASIDAPR